MKITLELELDERDYATLTRKVAQMNDFINQLPERDSVSGLAWSREPWTAINELRSIIQQHLSDLRRNQERDDENDAYLRERTYGKVH